MTAFNLKFFLILLILNILQDTTAKPVPRRNSWNLRKEGAESLPTEAQKLSTTVGKINDDLGTTEHIMTSTVNGFNSSTSKTDDHDDYAEYDEEENSTASNENNMTDTSAANVEKNYFEDEETKSDFFQEEEDSPSSNRTVSAADETYGIEGVKDIGLIPVKQEDKQNSLMDDVISNEALYDEDKVQKVVNDIMENKKILNEMIPSGADGGNLMKMPNQQLLTAILTQLKDKNSAKDSTFFGDLSIPEVEIEESGSLKSDTTLEPEIVTVIVDEQAAEDEIYEAQKAGAPYVVYYDDYDPQNEEDGLQTTMEDDSLATTGKEDTVQEITTEDDENINNSSASNGEMDRGQILSMKPSNIFYRERRTTSTTEADDYQGGKLFAEVEIPSIHPFLNGRFKPAGIQFHNSILNLNVCSNCTIQGEAPKCERLFNSK